MKSISKTFYSRGEEFSASRETQQWGMNISPFDPFNPLNGRPHKREFLTFVEFSKWSFSMRKDWKSPDEVAQLVGESSLHQKVSGLTPGQGTYLGYGFNFWSRRIVGQPINVSTFLSLSLCHFSLSLSLLLSKINKHILR